MIAFLQNFSHLTLSGQLLFIFFFPFSIESQTLTTEQKADIIDHLGDKMDYLQLCINILSGPDTISQFEKELAMQQIKKSFRDSKLNTLETCNCVNDQGKACDDCFCSRGDNMIIKTFTIDEYLSHITQHYNKEYKSLLNISRIPVTKGNVESFKFETQNQLFVKAKIFQAFKGVSKKSGKDNSKDIDTTIKIVEAIIIYDPKSNKIKEIYFLNIYCNQVTELDPDSPLIKP